MLTEQMRIFSISCRFNVFCTEPKAYAGRSLPLPAASVWTVILAVEPGELIIKFAEAVQPCQGWSLRNRGLSPADIYTLANAR